MLVYSQTILANQHKVRRIVKEDQNEEYQKLFDYLEKNAGKLPDKVIPTPILYGLYDDKDTLLGAAYVNTDRVREVIIDQIYIEPEISNKKLTTAPLSVAGCFIESILTDPLYNRVPPSEVFILNRKNNQAVNALVAELKFNIAQNDPHTAVFKRQDISVLLLAKEKASIAKQVSLPTGLVIITEKETIMNASGRITELLQQTFFGKQYDEAYVKNLIAGSSYVIAAYLNEQLIGFVRIMSDGHSLACYSELVVDEQYRVFHDYLGPVGVAMIREGEKYLANISNHFVTHTPEIIAEFKQALPKAEPEIPIYKMPKVGHEPSIIKYFAGLKQEKRDLKSAGVLVVSKPVQEHHYEERQDEMEHPPRFDFQ